VTGNLLIIGNLSNEPKGEAKLLRFLPVLVAAADNVGLVSANCPAEYRDKVVWIQAEHVIKKRKSYLTRIVNFMLSQIKLISLLATVPQKVKYEIVMFLRPYPAVMLFARLIGKKVVRYQGGVASKEPGTAGLLSRFLVEEPAAFFSHKIIIQSKSCLEFQNLSRYREKVVVGNFPINGEFFKCQKDVMERENIIGYIADLTENKGVRNFFGAILVLRNKDFKFIIGGVGPLAEETRKEIAENNLTDKVTLAGWIPHEEMPAYLNKLKLLILPSSSEGVPTILLEAMSCGTPTLATPVGGIPDILKDGENGFVLPDNSPHSIVQGIIGALDHPRLSEIAGNARKLLAEEYSHEAGVARFKNILAELE
jgi:glycosyltransferase involved in cell wall biosynthesis